MTDKGEIKMHVGDLVDQLYSNGYVLKTPLEGAANGYSEFQRRLREGITEAIQKVGIEKR